MNSTKFPRIPILGLLQHHVFFTPRNWCLWTCETRIDVWLKTAEFMMYLPISDAFNFDADRYKR
ncbi:DUF1133 family protein [Serratia fonticola]|uniref:DUF1133 family protein n=1 Tax=Serratia fonticola TaxID=47917 RepID=UPI0028F74737|nr:DUF1133 family protein [Serratia fonticola]